MRRSSTSGMIRNWCASAGPFWSRDFKANAALRFDGAKQTLYIKPIVKDVAASGDGKNGEIGQALIALLNGREFPVSMQKIDPLIAEAGAKIVTISTRIADIQAKEDFLQFWEPGRCAASSGLVFHYGNYVQSGYRKEPFSQSRPFFPGDFENPQVQP